MSREDIIIIPGENYLFYDTRGDSAPFLRAGACLEAGGRGVIMGWKEGEMPTIQLVPYNLIRELVDPLSQSILD